MREAAPQTIQASQQASQSWLATVGELSIVTYSVRALSGSAKTASDSLAALAPVVQEYKNREYEAFMRLSEQSKFEIGAAYSSQNYTPDPSAVQEMRHQTDLIAAEVAAAKSTGQQNPYEFVDDTKKDDVEERKKGVSSIAIFTASLAAASAVMGSFIADSKKWVEAFSPATIYLFNQEMNNLRATMGQGVAPMWQEFTNALISVSTILNQVHQEQAPQFAILGRQLREISESFATLYAGVLPPLVFVFQVAAEAVQAFTTGIMLSYAVISRLFGTSAVDTMIAALESRNRQVAAPTNPGTMDAASFANMAIRDAFAASGANAAQSEERSFRQELLEILRGIRGQRGQSNWLWGNTELRRPFGVAPAQNRDAFSNFLQPQGT